MENLASHVSALAELDRDSYADVCTGCSRAYAKLYSCIDCISVEEKLARAGQVSGPIFSLDGQLEPIYLVPSRLHQYRQVGDASRSLRQVPQPVEAPCTPSLLVRVQPIAIVYCGRVGSAAG